MLDFQNAGLYLAAVDKKIFNSGGGNRYRLENIRRVVRRTDVMNMTLEQLREKIRSVGLSLALYGLDKINEPLLATDVSLFIDAARPFFPTQVASTMNVAAVPVFKPEPIPDDLPPLERFQREIKAVLDADVAQYAKDRTRNLKAGVYLAIESLGKDTAKSLSRSAVTEIMTNGWHARKLSDESRDQFTKILNGIMERVKLGDETHGEVAQPKDKSKTEEIDVAQGFFAYARLQAGKLKDDGARVRAGKVIGFLEASDVQTREDSFLFNWRSEVEKAAKAIGTNDPVLRNGDVGFLVLTKERFDKAKKEEAHKARIPDTYKRNIQESLDYDRSPIFYRRFIYPEQVRKFYEIIKDEVLTTDVIKGALAEAFKDHETDMGAQNERDRLVRVWEDMNRPVDTSYLDRYRPSDRFDWDKRGGRPQHFRFSDAINNILVKARNARESSQSSGLKKGVERLLRSVAVDGNNRIRIGRDMKEEDFTRAVDSALRYIPDSLPSSDRGRSNSGHQRPWSDGFGFSRETFGMRDSFDYLGGGGGPGLVLSGRQRDEARDQAIEILWGEYRKIYDTDAAWAQHRREQRSAGPEP